MNGMAASSPTRCSSHTVTATWDELPKLLARYDGVADRILSYLGQRSWKSSPEAAERWAGVVSAVQAKR